MKTKITLVTNVARIVVACYYSNSIITNKVETRLLIIESEDLNKGFINASPYDFSFTCWRNAVENLACIRAKKHFKQHFNEILREVKIIKF